MSLQIGDKAPDFSIYSSDKELIHLHDYIGKNVVLLFFPLAFTSTCTTELCSTRDDIAIYNDLDTQVLGVSVDSPQTLKSYKAENQLNFKLLSDFNKEVIRAYDVIYEQYSLNMRGVGKRAVFVIDNEGTIRYIEVLESAGNLPDLPAVQNAVRQLQLA